MGTHITSSLTQWMKRSPGKLTVYAGILVLACALFFFWPGAYLDGYLKGRITRALEEAYPTYAIHIGDLRYRILQNRLECDSLSFTTLDSTISFSVARLSMSGIPRIKLLRGIEVTPEDLAGFAADAEVIVLNLVEEQFVLRCAHARMSVPDSSLIIDQMEFRPPMNDELFFAENKFRTTRFDLVVPQCRVTGLACLEMLQRKSYRARAAYIDDATFAVLVNKDKPVNPNSSNPRMPNAVLSSIPQPLRIDSINVSNGQLVYHERFRLRAKPAELTWDSIEVMAKAIGNSAGGIDTSVIRAQGIFMKRSVMKAQLAVRMASANLTFRYSGGLRTMPLSTLNPFIEIAEQKRLKTGTLRSAAFEINVAAGKASGTTSALYEDLKIVAIDDRTGSEAGFVNTIVSLFANNIKLRTTNMPDKSGSMKVGAVNYKKKSDETFLEFAWFAVRSGICDVVGF